MKKDQVIIIGSGPAGLACAAHLNNLNIQYRILEKSDNIGNTWKNHYDRLHLHTNKSSSALPFVRFGPKISKYPARDDVVAYLKKYCRSLNINPILNCEVAKVTKKDDVWHVTSNQGTFLSDKVIIATGNTNQPKMITKKGLNTFPGEVVHSSRYRNGSKYRGKKVLVVGFGNSACEIAICLREHGALPSMSVRSAVNVIPRDILGIPVLKIGILQSKLSPRLADKINKPLITLLIGDIEKQGLKKLPYGPTEQIVKHHQIPLLDIGTMQLIRNKEITVYGEILEVNNSNVHFENDQHESFDAIIMGTGYETGISNFLDISDERMGDIRKPISKRKMFGAEGLYFCGYFVSPTGMLREINIESGMITKHIAELNQL